MHTLTLATPFALEITGLLALGYATAQYAAGPARWVAAILAPAATHTAATAHGVA